MSDRVYFALCNGRIKIGTSADVEARMRGLASGHPDGVKVISTVDGGRDVEQALHRKLADHRLSGEWFSDCDEVRAAITDFQRSGIASVREHYRETQKRQRRSSSAPYRDPRILPLLTSEECHEAWDAMEERVENIQSECSARTAEVRLMKRFGVPREELRKLITLAIDVSEAIQVALKAMDEGAKSFHRPDVDMGSILKICSDLIDNCAAKMSLAEARSQLLQDDVMRRLGIVDEESWRAARSAQR